MIERSEMEVICGVDGCRGGWVAAIDSGSGITFEVFKEFRDILRRVRGKKSIVVVDVPIGLPAGGPRQCDLAARQLLGSRRSSVFPAPCRPTVAATSYLEGCALELKARGKKVTKQTHAILGKIREVDECLRPEDQAYVREAHPEVTFAMLGQGTGLRNAKKTREGRAERLAILQGTLGARIDPDAERTRLGRKVVGLDDLIDAAACLATARRVTSGRAVTLPTELVERDERSLRMEIVA